MAKLGVGMMRMPNDEHARQRLMDAAWDFGIRYYESCYFYLDYQCDEITHSLLRGRPRKDYQICNKMPVHGVLNEISPAKVWYKQQSVWRSPFEFYLLQALDRNAVGLLQRTKALEFLDLKKRSGEIGKLGFSFHDNPEWFARYLDMYDWDFVQLQFNMHDYFLGDAKRLYEMAAERNIPVTVMGGMKGGLLAHLPDPVAKVIMDGGCVSPDIFSMSFLNQFPGINRVLVGLDDEAVLRRWANVFMFGFGFDFDVAARAMDMYKQYALIDCTGCNYCKTVCPVGMPLSSLFHTYNKLLTAPTAEDRDSFISMFKDDVERCMNCGHCQHICPQKLPIQQLLHTKIFQMRA